MANKRWIGNDPSSSVSSAQCQALAALDTTELGAVNGITAGTVTASKAVVVDANKAQTELNVGTQASPVAMSSNLTKLAIVSGDFASDLNAAQDARMFHTRCKISGPIVSGGSIYGAFLQLRINSGSTATGAYSVSGAGQYAAAMAYIEASDSDNIFSFGGGKWAALHAKVESISDHTATGASVYGIQIGSAVKTTDFTHANSNWSALRIEKDSGYLDYKHAFSIDDCMSSAMMLIKSDGTVVSTSKTSAATNDTKVLGCIKLEIDSVTAGANVDRYIWLYSNAPT